MFVDIFVFALKVVIYLEKLFATFRFCVKNVAIDVNNTHVFSKKKISCVHSYYIQSV